MKKYGVCVVLMCCISALKVVASPKNDAKHTESYQFVDEISLAVTPVKDQANSGICWCFSGVGMVESELLRQGKGMFDLSEKWIVRHIYLEKAIKWVRMHGTCALSGGGTLNDVTYVMDRYGIVPEEDYPMQKDAATPYKDDELNAALKAYVEAIVKDPHAKLSTSWITGLNGILDAFLGGCPETFVYQGVSYTPKSFVEYLGIKHSDYVIITSFAHHAPYAAFALEIPDNWNWTTFYNVSLEELGRVVDSALMQGYTVNWATDISDQGWAFMNGFAIVPVTRTDEMAPSDREMWPDLTDEQISQRLHDPYETLPERRISTAMRQEAFDTYETTDDHGMLVMGIAKDQRGRLFYKVRNSWGVQGRYNGYCYVSKPFLLYKTIGVLVHKDGIPPEIKEKLSLN